MKRILMVLGVAGLAACASGDAPQAAATNPATLAEVHQSADWGNAPGATLDADYATGVNTVLRTRNRADALKALGEAGYTCIYGEAHADYPEPAAQCTRSFASRACQFDWEVFLTTDPAVPGEVDSLETSFRRDCVGVSDDWPEPVNSAIDDQLAPASRTPL